MGQVSSDLARGIRAASRPVRPISDGRLKSCGCSDRCRARPHRALTPMSQPRQQPLRPPRRPPLGPRDRGRLLRDQLRRRRRRPGSCDERSDLHVCPDVRPRRSSIPSSGRRPPRRTGRSSSAAPTASGRPSASTTRTRSTASTSSSTAAPRRSCATSSASPGPTWKRRSSASSRARLRRHLADGLLARAARRTVHRPSRPRARAPRAGPPAGPEVRLRAGHHSSASSRATSSTPVAAIASQTASASAGRPHGAHVQVRQRRVALAREDERQRHRPVQQVGPAVLARPLRGPETSSTSSSTWKASPIRRPKPPSPSASPPPSSAPSWHAASNRRPVLRSQRCM